MIGHRLWLDLETYEGYEYCVVYEKGHAFDDEGNLAGFGIEIKLFRTEEEREAWTMTPYRFIVKDVAYDTKENIMEEYNAYRCGPEKEIRRELLAGANPAPPGRGSSE
jgi:hypothetical protein